MKIITFAAIKGGVRKTTLTFGNYIPVYTNRNMQYEGYNEYF